jgi:hypothetical protein
MHEPYDDPYRSLPPAPVPATGSADPRATELDAEEEPVTTGTLFLTLILLMLIFGFWAMMYGILLHR